MDQFLDIARHHLLDPAELTENELKKVLGNPTETKLLRCRLKLMQLKTKKI